jgi:gliding motility-associated-like protein
LAQTLSVHPFPRPEISPTQPVAYVTTDYIKTLVTSRNPQTIFNWSISLSDKHITLIGDSTGTTAALDSGEVDSIIPQLETTPSSTVTSILYLITPESFGCIGEVDSVTFVLIPNSDPGIFIPGAISPNGDDFNDIWKVTWDEKSVNPDDYQIQLFNRSGGLVYTMRTLNSIWDGEDLPDGVYLYILKENSGGKYVRKGGLTIRREAKQEGE